MQGMVQEIPFSIEEAEEISVTIGNPEVESDDTWFECGPDDWTEVYRRFHEEYLLAEIAAGEGAGWN